MNQLLETKMRYQPFESLAGKTSSDRRLNFFKLLVGIFLGHWIGQTYCQGPRCFQALESTVGITRVRGGEENSRDQNRAFDNVQVISILHHVLTFSNLPGTYWLEKLVKNTNEQIYFRFYSLIRRWLTVPSWFRSIKGIPYKVIWSFSDDSRLSDHNDEQILQYHEQ